MTRAREAAADPGPSARSGEAKPARRPVSSRRRLLASLLAGVVCALPVARLWGATDGALTAWVVAAATYLLGCWRAVWPLDAEQTSEVASREDAGRTLNDVVLISIAAVSMVSVVVVMFGGHGKRVDHLVLGLLSIAGAWGLVQTVHLLRYARLYYAQPEGGLDFHDDEKPRYRDFAYLALTVGTTFQVSDTDVTDGAIRAVVMRHGLISFVFSAIVIATTINVVASLGS